jgi:hypothetical protein
LAAARIALGYTAIRNEGTANDLPAAISISR